jgi:hypothetical protein
LLELSRKAESALIASDYAKAYHCCAAFDSALASAGASAESLDFLRPVSQRVVRISAKALQQISDSLGRVCMVFDTVRYAEVLSVFGSLESNSSLSARINGAYEAAVLASVREFGGAANSKSFDGLFLELLKKLAAILLSLHAAIVWHEHGCDDMSEARGGMLQDMLGSRSRFCRTSVQSIERVLDSSTSTLRCPLEPRDIVSVYETTIRLNGLYEAFLRLSSTSLESIHLETRAEAKRVPKVISREELDGIPEISLRFAPRRGRAPESSDRFRKPLGVIGPGPVLLALNKWLSRQWELVHDAQVCEMRKLFAESAWLRTNITPAELHLLRSEIRRDCAIGPLTVSLREASFTLGNVMGSAGGLEWLSMGSRSPVGNGDVFPGSFHDASEVTLTPALVKAVKLVRECHFVAGPRVAELRTRCCRDVIVLFWEVLQQAFELLPAAANGLSLVDVLSTADMVRQRRIDGMKEHMPPAFRGQLSLLLAYPARERGAVSSRALTAFCVALECLSSAKTLLGPWLLLLCDSSDTPKGALDAQYVRTSLALCEAFSKASYAFCASSLVCDELRTACARVDLWAACAPGTLPTEVSPYVLEFLRRCEQFLSQRPSLPPESSHKLCVAICESAGDALVDGFGALPSSSVSSRMQMFFDARHLEVELEEATGLHPVPGAARLKQYIQAWFLAPEELRSWIDSKQRRLRLSDAHVEALSRQSASAANGNGSGGSAIRVMLTRAHSDFLGSFRSLMSVGGEEPVSTFTIDDDEEVNAEIGGAM